jgi:virginiamycin B lyase
MGFARHLGVSLTVAVTGLLFSTPGSAQLPGIVQSWETTAIPLRAYAAVVLSNGTPWFVSDKPIDNALFAFDPITHTPTPYYFTVSPPESAPDFQTLAADQNDVIWIADASDRLLRFDPASPGFGVFPLPSPPFTLPAAPFGVAVAPDGAVWFTCWEDRALGRFDPLSSTFQRFAPPGGIPDPPVEIAFDSAGIVYFTIRRSTGARPGLGRLDPGTGVFQLWVDPPPYTGVLNPWGIVRVGSLFWFLDHSANLLVRFDPATSSFVRIPMPPQLVDAHYLVADASGRLWFTALASARIGRFDPATSSFAWADTLRAQSGPMGIARSPDGAIWWAESGYLKPVPPPEPPAPPPAPELGYAGVGRYRDITAQPAPALEASGLAVGLCLLTAVGLAALRRMRGSPRPDSCL